MMELSKHACSCGLNKMHILSPSMIRSIPGLMGQIGHPHRGSNSFKGDMISQASQLAAKILAAGGPGTSVVIMLM